MAEFFAMGGYAQFVWGSFGITFIVLVLNGVFARRRLRSTLKDIALRHAQVKQRSNA